jgi:dTDP-4-amino-4,6-dideoxygalactose transaminase
MSIPFNQPFIAGKELYYIAQAVTFGNLSGDGHFTQKCSEFLRDRFGALECLMTPSCTAALEMAAILCDLKPGDEVIMPSFTFVSTANAFVRVGAKPVFIDIRPDTLNMDEALIEDAITDRTRVIVPVHYAGIGCEMDRIMTIADKYNLLVVEDAAQAVNAKYNDKYLGSFGHFGCYSFHETKNYICGEGGALAINDKRFIERAHIIRDKGTNRQSFLRGETDKYTWVDIGSSYVPSELCSAFLWAQLEILEEIAKKRRAIYHIYRQLLKPLEVQGLLRLPCTPEDCESNFHMFYVIVNDSKTRRDLLDSLCDQEITAVFHFVPLHSSPQGVCFANAPLPLTSSVSECIIRLPFFYTISEEQQQLIAKTIHTYFGKSQHLSSTPNNLLATVQP